jgi:hypothetical protein
MFVSVRESMSVEDKAFTEKFNLSEYKCYYQSHLFEPIGGQGQ